MKKILLRVIINTLLGIILIYAWTQFVDVQEVWQKLSTANPLIVIAIIFCQTAATILRVLRFKILLPDQKISLNQLSLLTFLSQLLTFVIPLRIGEFVKGIYISNQTNKPLASSVLWVFVDRLVDFWVVISLIGILLFVVPTAIPQNITQLIAALAIILSAGIVITIYYSKFIKQIVEIILKIVFIKRLRQILHTFATHTIDAFAILNINPTKQLISLVVTTLSWIFEAGSWYITFLALGVDNPSIMAVILGTMLMALSFILPSAPGYLGSMQAAGLIVFGLWLGFDPVTVSAATILLHLSIIIYVLISGIGSLYFLKLDLSDLFSRFKSSQTKRL